MTIITQKKGKSELSSTIYSLDKRSPNIEYHIFFWIGYLTEFNLSHLNTRPAYLPPITNIGKWNILHFCNRLGEWTESSEIVFTNSNDSMFWVVAKFIPNQDTNPRILRAIFFLSIFLPLSSSLLSYLFLTLTDRQFTIFVMVFVWTNVI